MIETIYDDTSGKDASQPHPDGHTWYDELIVSRSRIPDPESAPAPPKGLTIDDGLTTDHAPPSP